MNTELKRRAIQMENDNGFASQVQTNVHINTLDHNPHTNDVLVESWDPENRTLSYTFSSDFWDESTHNTLMTEFEGEPVTVHEARARGMIRRFQALYNTGEFPEVL